MVGGWRLFLGSGGGHSFSPVSCRGCRLKQNLQRLRGTVNTVVYSVLLPHFDPAPTIVMMLNTAPAPASQVVGYGSGSTASQFVGYDSGSS